MHRRNQEISDDEEPALQPISCPMCNVAIFKEDRDSKQTPQTSAGQATGQPVSADQVELEIVDE